MQDSTAKIPSGILNGNLNQYGDFDKCLSTLAPDNQYQGQYCLAYLQPRAIEHNAFLEYLRLQIHSWEAFKNDIDDVSSCVGMSLNYARDFGKFSFAISRQSIRKTFRN